MHTGFYLSLYSVGNIGLRHNGSFGEFNLSLLHAFVLIDHLRNGTKMIIHFYIRGRKEGNGIELCISSWERKMGKGTESWKMGTHYDA